MHILSYSILPTKCGYTIYLMLLLKLITGTNYLIKFLFWWIIVSGMAYKKNMEELS